VVCPVGRLTSDRLRGLADIADRFGSGTLRLTVWQNLPDQRHSRSETGRCARCDRPRWGWTGAPVRSAAGWSPAPATPGCKFSASDTKRHAAMLADVAGARITIDQPINIHLTGCHHSCAQHYAADIGLLATKIEQDDDMVEGYDLLAGGGAGPDQRLGRVIRAKVVTADLPPMILALLIAWQAERTGPEETFQSFTARHSEADLAALTERQPVEA
jgi:ferredoxin-nitrite reductase